MGQLVSPCLCSGSMRFVHLDCLEQARRGLLRAAASRIHTSTRSHARPHAWERSAREFVLIAVRGDVDAWLKGCARARARAPACARAH
eukprot:3934853-Pleurochrysis_carterae.AAC.3